MNEQARLDIDAYRQRRSERLEKRGILEAAKDKRFPLALLRKNGITPLPGWTYRDAWMALEAVGVTAAGVYLQLKAMRLDDASEGEEESENGEKPQVWHGHGNTRLPFGLCKREGIEIDPDWTPKDAWAALAGKGYSAAEAYKQLKESGHVSKPSSPDNTGSPDNTNSPEKPKQPETEKERFERVFAEREKKLQSLNDLRGQKAKAESESQAAKREFLNYDRQAFEYKKMIERHKRNYNLEELKKTDTPKYAVASVSREKMQKLADEFDAKAEEAREKYNASREKEAQISVKIKEAESGGVSTEEYRQAVQTMLEAAPLSSEVKAYRGKEQEARILRGRKTNCEISLKILNEKHSEVEKGLSQTKSALQSTDLSPHAKYWYEKKQQELEQYDTDFRTQIEALEAQKAETEKKLAETEKAIGAAKSGLSADDSKAWDDTYTLHEKYGVEPEEAYTRLSEVADNCRRRKVEYHGVSRYVNTPSEEEIISYIGGGDKTKGSCASLAFVYIANKAGFEVLDFRDGTSREFFSTECCDMLRKFDGIQEAKNTSDFKASKALLDTVGEGREYYFVTGKHAAMVRKFNGKLQYLELQSPLQNGWKDFQADTLKERFGAQKTHTVAGSRYEAASMLIDAEQLMHNPEFVSMMGFINTAQDKQRKGEKGRVR